MGWPPRHLALADATHRACPWMSADVSASGGWCAIGPWRSPSGRMPWKTRQAVFGSSQPRPRPARARTALMLRPAPMMGARSRRSHPRNSAPPALARTPWRLPAASVSEDFPCRTRRIERLEGWTAQRSVFQPRHFNLPPQAAGSGPGAQNPRRGWSEIGSAAGREPSSDAVTGAAD